MKRNMLSRAVYILMIAGTLGACKSKKAIVATPLPPPVSAPETGKASPSDSSDTAKSSKLEALQKNQTNFNTFSGKAKALLSIGTNSNDVTMNIRIKNNEVIWVSVTAIAGLEVARAMITPDSVKVINRLENEYIRKPFSYLYEFTNDKINFGTLQSVLVGNAMQEFITESTDVSINGTQSELKSIIGSMIYNLMLNEQGKVIQTTLKDESAGQSLVVNYDDFQNILQQQVSHSIVMKSQAKSKNISLDLKFTKIELDAMVDIPFRVPERFTIKN